MTKPCGLVSSWMHDTWWAGLVTAYIIATVASWAITSRPILSSQKFDHSCEWYCTRHCSFNPLCIAKLHERKDKGQYQKALEKENVFRAMKIGWYSIAMEYGCNKGCSYSHLLQNSSFTAITTPYTPTNNPYTDVFQLWSVFEQKQLGALIWNWLASLP